ncbi:MAG: LacI family DNA-binding transcriptional regulator [Pseudomonadota bacterium]
MHDVARMAGVSQMTVSRVMRGTGYISKNVRDQVLKSARQIGYIHNRLAGGNPAYDNPLVGVIVPTLTNRVFTEVLSGLSETFDRSGLRPVFGVSEYAPETEEELVFDLLSWRPRGLILPGLEHSPAVRQIIERTGVRVAEIMDSDGDPISACFGFSHRAAGRDMAHHMIAKGYRRFAFVAGQGGADLRANKRFEAFSAVVAEAGASVLDRVMSPDPSSMVEGRRMTAKLLSRSETPDAIYYANDELAAGGLMHCLAEGIGVPHDVALAGFNGLEFLGSLPAQITTTSTPRYDIGVAAAIWIARVDGASEVVRRVDFKTFVTPGTTT